MTSDNDQAQTPDEIEKDPEKDAAENDFNKEAEELLTDEPSEKSAEVKVNTVEIDSGEKDLSLEAPENLPLTKKKGKNLKKILLLAFLLLAVSGLIGGGIFVYQKAMAEKDENQNFLATETNQPTPFLTQIPTVEPTETPKLERKTLKLQILNGSGVAGAAGKAQAFLENLGYQSFEVGNADSYEFDQTEISVRESRKDYLDLLIADLEAEYALGEKDADLPEESEFDAVIIIGKD
ncbi:MAG: LytR C-terminal domain-containing protein [Candidatus Pacebacteria bacterium]|nr:LytR C-terminal domain-containing protein [Candidatus Paceibacterota bacterium]